MEKTGVLIERLLEQYQSNSGKEQLRITAQLLLSELEKQKEEPEDIHEVVSIFFPAAHFNFDNNYTDTADTITETKKEITIKPEPEIKAQPQITPEEKAHHFFDPMIDIPTLALKQQEINETVSGKQESLNDKLKSSSSYKEIGSTVTEAPIKDLRKAIGINDQYLFINELFRGDQTMYERSIKTINSFNIFGEAELWIKRELKLKLAWNDTSEAAALFDQLVRRRFS